MPAVLSQRSVSSNAHVLQLGRWVAAVSTETSVPDVGLSASDAGPASTPAWSLMWQLHRHGVSGAPSWGLLLGVWLLLSAFVAGFVQRWGSLSFPWGFAMMAVFGLGMAGALYVRHASDHDFIGLSPELLRVETHRARHVLRWDFNPRWVRIEPSGADGSLVRLSGQGRHVDIGRYVRADLRQQLAAELRWAIKQLTH